MVMYPQKDLEVTEIQEQILLGFPLEDRHQELQILTQLNFPLGSQNLVPDFPIAWKV